MAQAGNRYCAPNWRFAPLMLLGLKLCFWATESKDQSLRDYQYILVETRGEHRNVGVITLNRPKGGCGSDADYEPWCRTRASSDKPCFHRKMMSANSGGPGSVECAVQSPDGRG